MGRGLFVTALGVLSILSTALSTAHASPMEDPSLGGAVFTGPTHGHASSFFVNPAALGLTGRGWHFHVGSSARLSSLTLKRSTIGTDNRLQPGPTIDNSTISPGGILAYYASFAEGKYRFGVSLYTPTWQRFAEDDPSLGYLSNGGQIIQTMLTLAGSWKFTSRLIGGLGFSVGFSSLQLKFSRDSVLDGGSDSTSGTGSDCGGSVCGYENPLAREEYDIQVGNRAALGDLADLKNFSASIGFAYRLGHNSWLGMGYVVLPGAFETLTLSGDASITRAPRDGGGVESSNAEIGFGMAQMAFVGYRRPAFGTYNMIFDLRWQDWSRHSQFDIRLFGAENNVRTPEWIPRYRGLQDVWRVSAGLESDDSVAYRYGARLRLESAAISNENFTPTLVGGPNLTLATGTELRLSNHWAFSLKYEISLFPSITVENSAFDPREQVACVDSAFEFDACESARNGRSFATAAGEYSFIQHGMVMSFRYDSL